MIDEEPGAGVGVEGERRKEAARAGVKVIREAFTIPVRAAVKEAADTRAVRLTEAAAPQREVVGKVEVEVRVEDAVRIRIRNAAEDTVQVPAVEKRVESVVPGVKSRTEVAT